jgi:hypothetical protein
VGLRAVLDSVVKIKIPSPRRESNPRNLMGRDHSKYLGVDGRIMLEWILGKLRGKVWMGCIWLRTRTSGGLL